MQITAVKLVNIKFMTSNNAATPIGRKCSNADASAFAVADRSATLHRLATEEAFCANSSCYNFNVVATMHEYIGGNGRTEGFDLLHRVQLSLSFSFYAAAVPVTNARYADDFPIEACVAFLSRLNYGFRRYNTIFSRMHIFSKESMFNGALRFIFN